MPLRTACSSCGKKLQVRDELMGKKVKCPDCGKVFIAAAADAAAIKASPSKGGPPPMTKNKESLQATVKKPAGPPVRQRDEDDEVEDRPVRRGTAAAGSAAAGSGSSRLLWIALAGVLVLGGAGAAYYFFFMGPPASVGPIVKKGGAPVVPVVDPNQEKTTPETTTPVEEKTTRVETTAPSGTSALADLVPGDALFFATASGDLLRNKAFEAVGMRVGVKVDDTFQKAAGLDIGDLDRVSIFTLADFAESSKSKEPPVTIVVQTNKPIDQKRVALAIKKMMTGKSPAMTAQFPNQQTILIGTPAHLVTYHAKKGKTKATGVLERALALASTSKGALIAVVVPPEAEELGAMALKDVPVPLAPFLKTKSVLASLDVTDRLKLQATLFMEDAAAAGEAKMAADGMIGFAGLMLSQFGKDPQGAALALAAQQALKDLKINVQDKELVIAFETDMKVVMDAVMKGMMAVKGAATAAGDTNNLKQIALAWLNYHDVHKSYPPQTVGKGLSWRVAVLPYLEQEQLYKQFKLDEPWDSEHNKKLIPLMPSVYASGAGAAKPGFTFYQTFVGKKTINADPKKGMPIQRIPDGSSNTLIVAEAEKAVEWTKPDDVTVSDNEPIKLGGANPKFTVAALADGSVRRLPRDLDQKILRLLIDPADGQPIPDFEGPGAKAPPPVFKLPSKPPIPKSSEDKKPNGSGLETSLEAKNKNEPAHHEGRLSVLSRPPHAARQEDEVKAYD